MRKFDRSKLQLPDVASLSDDQKKELLDDCISTLERQLDRLAEITDKTDEALQYVAALPPFSDAALNGVMHIAFTGHMGRTMLRIVEGLRMIPDTSLVTAADTSPEELAVISERLAFNIRALMVGAREDYGVKEAGTYKVNRHFDEEGN